MTKRNQRTSLAAFMLVLLFAGAADGLMEALGFSGFVVSGVVVLGVAWALTTAERRQGEPE